jgi:prepilin-type N-terminal cleavage/methylation domain-containing protein
MNRIRRSGFTLSEVIIALVIISIVGAAFTRILTYQTRYLAHETSLRTARSVARTATNILTSDLRTVQDSGGVDSVTADGKLIRILVPYRFGVRDDRLGHDGQHASDRFRHDPALSV